MRLAIVLVGRNEADRLPVTLPAAKDAAAVSGAVLVYVDSGSTDESARIACAAGAEIVHATAPHSAAAGRNTALRYLTDRDIDAIQFVDADCILHQDWLPSASAVLEDASVAAVYGRLTEERPDASIYQTICELEWRQIPDNSFGGNILIRRSHIEAAGGYDEQFVASEDHDLSLRLCGRVVRLECQMATHDARITHLHQWWRREVRRGIGVGLMFHRHRRLRERQIIRRARLWTALAGAMVATTAIGIIWPPALILTAGLVGLHVVRFCKITRDSKQARTRREALLWAAHCTACVAPNTVGLSLHAFNRCMGLPTYLVEYHRPPRSHELREASRRGAYRTEQ